MTNRAFLLKYFFMISLVLIQIISGWKRFFTNFTIKVEFTVHPTPNVNIQIPFLSKIRVATGAETAWNVHEILWVKAGKKDKKRIS